MLVTIVAVIVSYAAPFAILQRTRERCGAPPKLRFRACGFHAERCAKYRWSARLRRRGDPRFLDPVQRRCGAGRVPTGIGGPPRASPLRNRRTPHRRRGSRPTRIFDAPSRRWRGAAHRDGRRGDRTRRRPAAGIKRRPPRKNAPLVLATKPPFRCNSVPALAQRTRTLSRPAARAVSAIIAALVSIIIVGIGAGSSRADRPAARGSCQRRARLRRRSNQCRRTR